MPFVSNSSEPRTFIDPNRNIPVAVITSFNSIGKFVPLYVNIINPDESQTKLKIEEIKDRNEFLNGVTFRCLVNVDGYYKELVLTFFIKEHTWYMRK